MHYLLIVHTFDASVTVENRSEIDDTASRR